MRNRLLIRNSLDFQKLTSACFFVFIGLKSKEQTSILKTTIFIVTIITLSACNNPFRKAEYYHDYLTSRQSELMTKIFELSRNLTAMDSAAAFQALDAAQKFSDGITEEIKHTPSFRKDTSLRHATLEVADAYSKVIATDLSQMAEKAARAELSGPAGTKTASRIRRAIMKKLVKTEKEFARQEGQFRRAYLGGKDFIPADSTYFSADTTENSEF